MSGKDRPLQQLSSNAISAKELARSLGLVKKTPSSSTSRKRDQEKEIKRRQHFTYLIVLDFESTCWKDKKLNYGPEIIEFPAVLLNTSTGELESEFQMFVQPREHAKLSEFCRELTGITQAQVDDGIPIGTCLMLFGRWLQEMKDKKGFKFPCEQVQKKDQEKTPESLLKWCTFVTWSDWDLGTCLKNECYRKQLRMPHPLRSWIDLRATYKNFYSRKPQGLAGALQDLGIKFSGREHSGLDDARNTARLAWRMISDGCLMQITKTIDGMLEKLWMIVTQNGPSQSDSNKVSETAHTNTSSNKDFFKSSSESKNSAQAELTKFQIKPSKTSERNVRESLNFSRVHAEDRVEREVIAGLCQHNIAGKNKFTGSGVDYPSDKMTIVKGKDHIVIMQRNEAKTDENCRAVAVVPGLKRRAPQGIGSLTSLSNVCSVSNTGCDYTPKCLITPSTSLSTVNKRARGCYGGLKSETPKSSTPGRILKQGLLSKH
ncbi:ERI1 exoribonuclease 2 [Desmophyllum pertusum]|uniref:ERI1 exoribonuclease 2 n=1 Tax=Desmophyllum pertusum TaxID=174260 RepID=A0A9W9YT65_9CNID|nr:ERI1 exoribonuclease 2 [Desmophyllum pertusum]